MISDPEQLLEQVLASHDVRIENGQHSFANLNVLKNP